MVNFASVRVGIGGGGWEGGGVGGRGGRRARWIWHRRRFLRRDFNSFCALGYSVLFVFLVFLNDFLIF